MPKAKAPSGEPVTLYRVPGLFIAGVPHTEDPRPPYGEDPDHPIVLSVADPDIAAYLQATGAYVAGEPYEGAIDFEFRIGLSNAASFAEHLAGRGETWPPHDSTKPADQPEPLAAHEEAVI